MMKIKGSYMPIISTGHCTIGVLATAPVIIDKCLLDLATSFPNRLGRAFGAAPPASVTRTV